MDGERIIEYQRFLVGECRVIWWMDREVRRVGRYVSSG